MQLLSVVYGKLLLQIQQSEAQPSQSGIITGLVALDELMPAGGLMRGAVHEVLSESYAAWFFAVMLARSAAQDRGAIVWSDRRGELYAPALAASAIDRLYLLRSYGA